MTKIRLFVASCALALAACAHTTQYTSGADYLARYNDSPAYQSSSAVDADIRDIAAVEPDFRFPARIGLARLQHRNLTTVPQDEAEYWAEFSEKMGRRYGDLIPISPLVTSMVVGPRTHQNPGEIVNDIRKGAARQHLDYVLIYEVGSQDDRTSNALRITDLTVLGLFVMPSRDVEIKSTASAILVDVRNGYPYGTATSFADKAGASTFAGRNKKRDKLEDQARLLAVSNLTKEIEEVFEDLRDKKYQKMVEAGY